MIYIDSSVALAWLAFEPRAPRSQFWATGNWLSSRLLDTSMNRLHAYGLSRRTHKRRMRFWQGYELLEMERLCWRALWRRGGADRTLDALHLATADYLQRQANRSSWRAMTTACSRRQRPLGIPSPHSSRSSAVHTGRVDPRAADPYGCGPAMTSLSHIRNFAIIAHIDHASRPSPTA